MSHRDQRAFLPSQCSPPRKVTDPPSRCSNSKVRASPRATPRKGKNRDQVKPPANGFLLFRSEYVHNPANQISTDGSRKRQVDLTKEAGVAWRRLSQAQRDIYCATARQNMEDHKTRHPDYWSSRRGKDGKYTRADSEREQGSSVSVKASQGGHEAVLSVDLCSESAAPTAAHSPSCDAPSPCPSLTSSVSDDDCLTPQALCQRPLVPSPLVVDSSSEQPLLDGWEPPWFSNFINELQFLPLLASPNPLRSSLEVSLDAQLSTDSYAGLAASKEFLEPTHWLLYEDWAFGEGEELFVNSATALGDTAAPHAGFLTF